MRLHFVVLPPPEISNEAGKLAKLYSARHKHWFVVDNKKLYPHITLFLQNFPRNKFKTVISEVESLLTHYKKFKLQITGLETFRDVGGGWLGIDIKSNRELSKLRKEIHGAVSPYLIGKTKSLRRPYRPHITLTKFKDHKNALNIKRTSTIKTKNFDVDEAAICTSDRFWQVYKVLKRFKLK